VAALFRQKSSFEKQIAVDAALAEVLVGGPFKTLVQAGFARLEGAPEIPQPRPAGRGDDVRLGLGNDLLSLWVFGPTQRDDAREVGADGYRPLKSGGQMTGGVLRGDERQLAAALKTPALADAGDAEKVRGTAAAVRLGEDLFNHLAVYVG
jgi:hypothetical protein